MTQPLWVEDYFAPPGPALENASSGALPNVATTEGKRRFGRVRFTGEAPVVSGFASGSTGRKLTVYAVGGALVLENESTNSLAANRILTGTGGDLTIAQEAAASLEYDDAAQRWQVVGGGGGGSGDVSDGENLGGGVELYKGKSAGKLQHRTIEANTSTTISTARGKSFEQKTNTVRLQPLPPGWYNVADFGTIDPTGATDCSAVIQAAIDAVKAHTLVLGMSSWKAGGVVYLPPGNYRCSSPLLIDGSITLRGAHGKGDWGTTNLLFDENLEVDALIKIKQTGGAGTYGNFACIQDLIIQQLRSAARDFRIVTCGVLVQANGVHLIDIAIDGIGGDGLVIGKPYGVEDEPVEFNANCFALGGHIRITKCDRYGVHLQGTNSNAGGLYGVIDVSYCGSWGISNRSFLGCHFDIVHTASNGALIHVTDVWVWRTAFNLELYAPGIGVWEADAVVPAGKPYLPTIENCPLPYQAFIVVSDGGTTGGTEPDWSAIEQIGDTVVDGTVTWTAYAEIGGSVLTTGANNRSTYSHIYAEGDQNEAHAPDGAAAFMPSGCFYMTPESEVRLGPALEKVRPIEIGPYARRPDNPRTYWQGLSIKVGDKADPLKTFSWRADYHLNPISEQWDYDWGQWQGRWDIDAKRWVHEAYFEIGPRQNTSFSVCGGRSLPFVGAVCFPSLWLGGKMGEESRGTALPAKATAPYAPDFTDAESGALGMFEENDFVLNRHTSGRPHYPFAWRARKRSATVTAGGVTALGWDPNRGYLYGEVIQDGTGFWRVLVEGDTDADPENKPAFVDAEGNTYVEGSGLTWEWAGSTTIGDAAWEPIIDRAPTTLEKSVAGSSNVTLTLDESAHARFKFTGVLTGNIYVVIDPGGANGWDVLVENATTGAFTLTVKTTSGGVGVPVARNTTAHLKSDGTDVSFATSAPMPPHALGALDIDWSKSTSFTKTLAAGGNTLTFSNVAPGMTIIVRLTSNGGGSTVTWPTVKWPGGTPPTQTSTGTDLYTLFYDGTDIFGMGGAQAFA